jgi:four helix bundle protein
MFGYQKLEIYQLSKVLVKETYRIINGFPAFENYGLSAQMSRSAISIPSNIAEGSGRSSKRDKMHYITIAYASLLELSCQYEIAFEIGYIENEELKVIETSLKDLAVKLTNFKRYLSENQAAKK